MWVSCMHTYIHRYRPNIISSSVKLKLHGSIFLVASLPTCPISSRDEDATRKLLPWNLSSTKQTDLKWSED